MHEKFSQKVLTDSQVDKTSKIVKVDVNSIKLILILKVSLNQLYLAALKSQIYDPWGKCLV